MVLKENEETYVYTKRIEFKVKDSEETDFVTLREFNMQEAKQFQSVAKVQGEEVSDPVAAINKAEEFFPGCVVDSSFTKENGEKASGKEIYNYLKRSSSLFQMILSTWLRSDDSPFQLITEKNKN